MPRSLPLILLPLVAGCLAYSLVGAEPHEGVPPGADRYVAVRCVHEPDKSPVEGPRGMTFYVVTGTHGLNLMEIDNGTKGGNAITNHWSDPRNDYFFTYREGRGPAWFYEIPADRSQAGRRLTYPADSYTITSSEGHPAVEGHPDTSCVLDAQGTLGR
jgi:hypothetical protein